QGGPKGARLTYVRQKMVHDANWEQLEQFSDFAKQRGITETEAAFGWLAAQQPVASVIAGATRVEQVQQNAKALEYELTADDLAELDVIFPPVKKIALF